MLLTSDRVAEKLLAFGPLGYFFALILGRDGHLSRIPLLVGGTVGTLGRALKLAQHRMKKEAL
jgi:hypothetical protein